MFKIQSVFWKLISVHQMDGTMNVLYGVGGGGIGLSALVVCLIKKCKKSNSTSVTIIVQPCPE